MSYIKKPIQFAGSFATETQVDLGQTNRIAAIGIQSQPGVVITLKGNTDTSITLGVTGIYELELSDLQDTNLFYECNSITFSLPSKLNESSESGESSESTVISYLIDIIYWEEVPE